MSRIRHLRIPVAAAPAPMLAALGDERVSVNSRYIVVDGQPVFPVSGEIHYSRLPREVWDATLRRARAGGLTHVATYAIWNHHEDADGVLSFTGDLDLRHFLELAAGHGFELVLRLGPYVHSEARHGGLPDRIADGDWDVRTNDEGYLAQVERWYAALAEQVRGIDLFAVQVENELYDRPEHIEALRAIAERRGFTAPLWTATAWGGAQLPDDVLPLYGGYSDSFWIESTDLRDERSLTNFYPTKRRDDDGIGADHRGDGDSPPRLPELPRVEGLGDGLGRRAAAGEVSTRAARGLAVPYSTSDVPGPGTTPASSPRVMPYPTSDGESAPSIGRVARSASVSRPGGAGGGLETTDDAGHPFATCELGGGMVSAYHRRPVVTARDVEALGIAKLASGSVWQGYYMYSDGRNPRRGLQEAHAVGAPNDFMELGYDFGAALTLDAVPRETWFRLRRQHLLLQHWGPDLATMPAVLPDGAPDHPDETALRWSVRSDGERGFLLAVNHQPSGPLPAHDGVTFVIELDGGTVEFPPVDIPSGTAFAWPFGLRLAEAEITWATAQPVTEVTWQGLPLLVLAEVGGIPAAFASDVDVVEIDVDGPGTWWVLEVADRAVAHVVALSDAESLRLGVPGGQLVLADGVVTTDRIEAFAPAPDPLGAGGDHLGAEGDLFGPATYSLRLTDDGWLPIVEAPVAMVQEVPWRIVTEAGTPPESIVADNGRASVPTDWSAAARVSVTVPGDGGTLVLDWVGDVARVWDGDRLVSDAIWNGREWRITAPERAGARVLDVEILPLAEGAPVLTGAPRPHGWGIVDARLEHEATQPSPAHTAR